MDQQLKLKGSEVNAANILDTKPQSFAVIL